MPRQKHENSPVRSTTSAQGESQSLPMEGELPGDTVSAEQVERYCLNAGGWYALRGVLSPAEAASLRAAIADDPSAAAALAALSSHPTLRRHVSRIMRTHSGPVEETAAGRARDVRNTLPGVEGTDFTTDVETHVLASRGRRLEGGAWEADGHRHSGRGFTPHGSQELCPAVRVFWALEPSGGEGHDSALSVVSFTDSA